MTLSLLGLVTYQWINTFSWEAYNENTDLKHQVEAYRIIHGHYPELVQVDRIYATRENREWLQGRGNTDNNPTSGKVPGKRKADTFSYLKNRGNEKNIHSYNFPFGHNYS